MWFHERTPADSDSTVECFQSQQHMIKLTVDFNSPFIEMFRTSFRTSEVRCEVHKFIIKFTNQFVKLAFDWLLSNV